MKKINHQRAVMGQLRLSCMLLATVLTILVLTTEGHHTPMTYLSYGDIMTVFAQVAQPFEVKKTARNQQLDREVDFLIGQIDRVVPGLGAVNALLQNLSAGLPLLRTHIAAPFRNLTDSLGDAVHTLQQCTEGVDIPIPHQRAGADTFEEDDLAEDETPRDSDADKSSETGGYNHSALTDLISPVDFDDSTLQAIVEKYGPSSVVTLHDAIKAFRTLANKLAQEHLVRFLSLVPRVATVKQNIGTIVEHVTKDEVILTKVNKEACEFVLKTVEGIDELKKLTSTANRMADVVC